MTALIIDSLKRGDFYASQGPEMDEISIRDNRLYVSCSDANAIVVYTDCRNVYVKEGKAINEAEFTLTGDEKYISVMCRDKEKSDANANTFWMNGL